MMANGINLDWMRGLVEAPEAPDAHEQIAGINSADAQELQYEIAKLKKELEWREKDVSLLAGLIQVLRLLGRSASKL